MNKIPFIRTIILFFIFVGQSKAYSQSVANYSVSRSTGITYSSIFGTGSSIASWRNNTDTYPQDDNRSSATDIGFDFWYLGVRYTQFNVSSNGFIDFSSSTADGTGSAAYGYDNTRFSSTTTTALSLAPIYDDLTAKGGVEALGYSVKYLTEGTAPNRVLTVEWIDMAVYSNVTPSLNFQVKLYETTGVIEFIYGTMTKGTHTFTYTCGINASTVSSSPTSAQLLTQQSENSTTFSNTAKNNLATLPTSNSRIRFTPNNHTGTFNGGLTFSNISSSGMRVNYSDWCSNERGYVLYNSIDNENFTFVVQQSAGTTNYTVSDLTPGTTYYWRVYAVTEGKLSSAATGNATTSAAGNKVSKKSGNWSTAGDWDPSGVPAATDNVVIANGHTMVINANASCNNLTVGQGSSGTLTVGNNGTTRSLTVKGDLVVNNGGILSPGTTNATHTATIEGNITNNGTLDFRPTASRLVNLTINGKYNLDITGSGGTTRFNNIVINMNNNVDNILNFNTTNLTLQNGSITLNSGTLKFSSNYTLNHDFTSSNLTIPSIAGIHVNNPNVTLNLKGNVVLAGKLIVDTGIINIGDASNEYLESKGGVVEINGGAMNVAGRYFSTNINTLSNFSISGGVFTVPVNGSTDADIYPFQINATGSSFNMSGGTIVLQREGGSGSNDLGLYLDGLTTNVITGGTVQFGNNSTPSSQTFKVHSTSNFPNFTIHNNKTTVSLLSNININNDLTITGGTLLTNNQDVNIQGNWSSSGTYTAGSNTTTFDGAENQTISKSSVENFNNIIVSKSSGNLILSASISANDVTLTNGNLQINSNTLTLNSMGSGSGRLIGSNTSNLTINGTGSFGTLKMSNTSIPSKTLNNFTVNRSGGGSVTIDTDSLRIKNTLDVQNGTLNTSDRLILVSDVSNTARIAALTTGTISGNIIAQRFIPGGTNKRQWRYISSPVNVSGSISIQQFIDDIFVSGPGGSSNGFDDSPNNTISIRTYNESKPGHVDSGWVSPANANATFPTGTGISVFVRGSRNLENPFLNWTTPDDVTIDLVGEVNKGNFTFNLSYTNSFTSSADGINFIGNPYPSQIDFLAASGITKTNMSNYFTAYNAKKRVYGVYNGAMQTGTNDISRYIPSGQAFFVKATGAGASLQLTENVKVANSSFDFFRNPVNPNILSLVLERDSLNSDELLIAFSENASKYDSDESDIPKLFNESINFYSKSLNNVNLTINEYPFPEQVDTINLSAFAYESGVPATGLYSILFRNVETIREDVNLYLADFYLNKTIDIRNHDKYQFEITSDAKSMGNNRFKLIFGNSFLSTQNSLENELILFPNPSNKELNILFSNSVNNTACRIEMYDQLGKNAFKQDAIISNAKLNLDVSDLSSGIYLIKVNTESTQWSSKFMKQ